MLRNKGYGALKILHNLIVSDVTYKPNPVLEAATHHSNQPVTLRTALEEVVSTRYVRKFYIILYVDVATVGCEAFTGNYDIFGDEKLFVAYAMFNTPNLENACGKENYEILRERLVGRGYHEWHWTGKAFFRHPRAEKVKGIS